MCERSSLATPWSAFGGGTAFVEQVFGLDEASFVSFSFKKILDNNNETTQTQERIGAAIAPFPLIAYT